MSWAWPLIGRAEELRFIASASGDDAGPGGIVLAGAAGVGKSRLAREAMAAAERDGWTVRWVVATASSKSLPLGAFAALLGSVGPDPTHLVRHAIEVLGSGRPGRVIVAVDDAHLLDALSAFLVHQLVLRRLATVVLTVRSGEPAQDAVTAIWKDGLLIRLDVQPLSADQTTTLIEAALGGPVDSVAGRRLWSITQGNVLYLSHLLDGEMEAGRLRDVAGVWGWSGQPQLPPGLADLVLSRVGSLTDDEREVIDVLAFGEPLGVPLIARLVDRSVMERLETRGLVGTYSDGRRLQAHLMHPLYGEVRRAKCGHLRSRRLRGQIAQALDDTGARRVDDQLRQAVLMLESDLRHDAAVFTAGAGRAAAMLDFTLCSRLARAAVDAEGGFEPHMMLGFALSWSGRGDAAETELSALMERAETDAGRARVTVVRTANLFWTLARPTEAEAVLSAAFDDVTDDSARDELTGIQCVFNAFMARPVQAETTAREVLATAANPAASTFAGWGLVMAGGARGRMDGLDVTVQRIEGATDAFNSPQVRIGVGVMWLRAMRLVGMLHAAERVARQYHDSAQEAPGPAYLFTGAALGEVARDRGLVLTAIRLLRQAATGLAGRDPGGWRFQVSAALALAHAMAGDVREALAALADMDANRHPAMVFMEPDALLAHAWVAAAGGTTSAAIRLARQAANLAATQGQPGLEVLALQTAVCFGDRTVADRLAVLARQVDGPRAQAAAAHAAALAKDDGTALQAASVQLETMGAMLLAADAAAHSAVAYARHGRRASSYAAAARARTLAEACEGARTPALVAASAPLPLTDREREVVTLAADGLTNREIAQRLVVSVRTVEGHLYRACAKLGTSNRTEFAALLRGD